MSTANDPEARRAELRAGWETAAAGWRDRADAIRDWGMPVSTWLIDHLELQPGLRVLELAAGPGDTGFLAAEIVAPGGGVVISSDGAEAMVEVARSRAEALGVRGMEFRQLELEWIDLPTADVDRIVCRWGVMLAVDPAACLSECRRVLRPGGRLAIAVWDTAEANPWLTLPRQALGDRLPAADSGAPGPLSLADPDRLRELLGAAGFVEVEVEAVTLERRLPSVEAMLAETLALSMTFRTAWDGLTDGERDAVAKRLRELAGQDVSADGTFTLRGRSLMTAASA